MPAMVMAMFRRRAADEGPALLGRARSVQVATVSAAGRPRLVSARCERIHDELVLRSDGEDLGDAIDTEVVVSAEETIATFGDLRYRMTAQAAGRLRARPADASQEGRSHHARAAAALPLANVSFHAHLGAGAPLEARREALARLWQRGGPGDAAAIELLLDRLPELDVPDFLRPAPELAARGLRLHCDVAHDQLDDVLDLLEGLYWLRDVSRAAVLASILASTAVAAATDENGTVVAFARAVSDGKTAWIYDVAVAPALRGSAVGSAVMRLLLDHATVRNARHVRLTTRDAMTFYGRLGFRALAEAPRHPWPSVEMIRSHASLPEGHQRPGSEGAHDPEAVGAAGSAEDRHQQRLS